MILELLDIFIITVVLLLSLIFVYYRIKKLLHNTDNSQCNGCIDKTCGSKYSSKDGLNEKPSCHVSDEIK
jgi:hypothetical protein